MKFRQKFKTILIALLFPATLFCQSNEHLKVEAMEFSMSIIKTYFTGDCESLFLKFAPQIYSLIDEEIIIRNEEFKEELCYALEDAIDDPEKTFADYQIEYLPKVFSKKEFEEKYGAIKIENFKILESDFFFLGNEMVDPSADEYLWDELEVIMIRKIDEKWWVVGGK